MIYKEFQPDVRLVDLVKCYWWFDHSGPEHHHYTILPDGCFDLLVHFKSGVLSEVSLTGLWTKQVEVCIDPDTQIFAIRFKLLAADYIFGHSIAPICNGEMKLENDYWQLAHNNFSELQPTVDFFNKTMVCILESGKAVDKKKQKLFGLLYQSDGGLTIENYSKEVFWSARQINRYFSQRFGLSLKAYSNILKCAASYPDLQQGKLYPEENYFDQSHFIKSLKKHTGSSPSELSCDKNDRFLQLQTLKDK
ncbi:hypothetical protein RT99_00130 [Flavobacterium sp. MEB061]|uniref:helix-turn-helix domain-containing protein n=1 Tax=Flavobacterium sp. MEB061 TaxID=1587524 RepID=UPI0005AD0888|nr:AraC family transcriptional regulator [Flavobacterium sp. MEB061]KIQ25381.1 hypothetical protein RT99_00130 [Flavobacterium sp. MEB061]